MTLTLFPDSSILLDTRAVEFAAAREAIAPFAELVKSPELFHTYRMTPLSLWSAVAAGLAPDQIIERLRRFSAISLDAALCAAIAELAARWGRLRLERAANELLLTADDPSLLAALLKRPAVAELVGEPRGDRSLLVLPQHRGALKQALVAAGWPAEDLAGYEAGAALEIRLRPDQGALRDYQHAAAAAFYAGGAARGGSGVVALPPGAGKTLVGIGAMALIGQSTLIVTSGRTSVSQWRRELLRRTNLTASQVAEYGAESKAIAPVTITTYQMLAQRDSSSGAQRHIQLFSGQNWGLIIYDEVHMLPAPVFRVTAAIQARRRLGLTATLIREDGCEGDVFALVGPKRYEAPWRMLEAAGWIAAAACREVRVALAEARREAYALAERRVQHRIAAENPAKLELLRPILARHPGAPALVIGQYLDQLRQAAAVLDAPLISGALPQAERERLFDAFRRGALPPSRHSGPLLVISRVGNLALDLPDAEVLIQLSGTFGSRQEEAQRLGRVLRPKPGGRAATFYTLVTRTPAELDFAHNRQLFLAEQGYAYEILDAEDL